MCLIREKRKREKEEGEGERKMATVTHNKIKLREVNRHLVCRLCRGYYVDATTIAECLHSFCRSCIIKYLEKNSFCPVCEVQIHKTKPYLNLRLDKALQDVVYKLVPGLYHDEMKRRREFYAKHQEQIPVTTPEQCGLEERILFSPEDSISLSLEYLESDDFETETVSSQSSESGDNPDGLYFPQQLGLMKLKNGGEGKTSRRESQDVQENSSYPKRYLQCPAVVTIFHLKKFIRMKHELTDRMQVDIIHKRVPLPDQYTLMDVAYIYTWKRSAPLRFFYQIYHTHKHKLKIQPSIPEEQVKNSETTQPLSVEKNESVQANDVKVDAESKKVSSEVKTDLISGDKNLKIETKPSAAVTEKTPKLPCSEKQRLESARKLEIIVNGIKEEKKGLEKNAGVGGEAKVNSVASGDKCKSGGLNALVDSNNRKVDCDKSKSAKPIQTNGNAQQTKEKTKEDNERLLLNPISGQLESVPSINQTKPGVNGVTSADEKKENVATTKTQVVDQGAKKLDAEQSKEVKKSSVNLLKSFRKDKSALTKDSGKVEVKNNNGNTLTITTVAKSDKPSEKEPAKVSVEIKADKKASEYDFDGTSPPNKIIPLQEYSKMSKYQKQMSMGGEKQTQNNWMSLQDFRMHMLKENNSCDEDLAKKDRRKSVPSLVRIGPEGNKKSGRKTPNDKLQGEKPKPKKSPPTIINIKTENCDKSKTEIKIEVPEEKDASPPRPIKIENKGGEYSIKAREDENPKKVPTIDKKSLSETNNKPDEVKVTVEENNSKDSSKGALKRSPQGNNVESESAKKSKPNVEDNKNDHFGAIDLTKTESSPKMGKNPLENLMDLASKSGAPKSDENMVEALISVAQKQSIEPLLKIPQYSKNSSQGSPPLAKNISSNDISQALQFFKDLRSDIKVLEAKNQLSPNSFLEQFSQKSANLEPIQLYQQHIDLIRRLKRQQMAANEADTPQRKQAKLSPTSEAKRKESQLEEKAQLKSSLEKTLTQIQEIQELQSRMMAAQNYKNLPGLLQFYNRPPAFCPTPGPTSPSKSNINKTKSSHSPNSQKSPTSRKSPQSLTTTPSGSLPHPMPNLEPPFFSPQNYSHLINAGLNSEMTFHQMFQNYLSQQDKLNQIKHSQTLAKKVGLPSAKSISDLYYGSQACPKKQEPGSVGAAAQKT